MLRTAGLLTLVSSCLVAACSAPFRGEPSQAEIDAILVYLDTLIGAPKLVRGKAVAVALGCRGCHKIGGLGGDLGLDLAEAAARPEGEYDFSGVVGPHTIVNWQREHLRDPQRVAPGSQMPPYLLAADDEDALITYVLSLRRPDLPLEELPPSTVMACHSAGPWKTLPYRSRNMSEVSALRIVS